MDDREETMRKELLNLMNERLEKAQELQRNPGPCFICGKASTTTVFEHDEVKRVCPVCRDALYKGRALHSKGTVSFDVENQRLVYRSPHGVEDTYIDELGLRLEDNRENSEGKVRLRKQYKTIDDYIASFPQDVQIILQKIRQTVREAAPEATEAIRYGMPALNLNGNPLVYFAGFKSHIGFYPIPSGVEAFAKELSPYKQGKGSVQFPLDKPIPYDLVKKIVAFRVKENLKNKSRKA